MAQTRRKTDREIQADVADELLCTAGVDTAHVNISVKGGMVTLHGDVHSAIDRLATTRAVGRVVSVRAVVDELVVRDPGTPGTDDSAITAVANRMLEAAADVPAGTIHVGVRDRVVTLSGEVASHLQRDAALRTVRHIRGVVGLTNNIRIVK